LPPLGVLFLFLAAGFAGLAVTAARANAGLTSWVIAAAAIALAAWFGNLAFRILRSRR